MWFANRRVVGAISAFALLVSIAAAQAESAEPARIKPADLPEGYIAVKVKNNTGWADMMSNPMMMVGMSSAGGRTVDQAQVARLLEALEIYWSKSERTVLFGREYVAVYRLEPSLIELSKLMETGDGTALMLQRSYIQTDLITSVTPRPDITKDVFLSMLGYKKAPPAPEVKPGDLAPARANTLSHAKQLALATIMFSADHEDILPYALSTRGALKSVEPYLKSRAPMKSQNPASPMFQFNMALTGVSLNDVAEPGKTPLFYDSKEWPDGSRVVAFVDGRSAVVGKEEWPGFEKYLKLNLKRHGKPLPKEFGSDIEIG